MCQDVLPPPSPQPDPGDSSTLTDLAISLEMLEPFVVVLEDNVVVSPSSKFQNQCLFFHLIIDLRSVSNMMK